MEKVYIGLGSNLGDRERHITEAVAALDALSGIKCLELSTLYETPPMGPQNQQHFVNAVLALDAELSAKKLLQACQQIERDHSRERQAERWGPRTLDLDILLYGQQVITTQELVVPHYGLADRYFALYPLVEIAPEAVMPDGTKLVKVLSQCPKMELHRL